MKHAAPVHLTVLVDEPDYYVQVRQGVRGSFHWQIRAAGVRGALARSHNRFSSRDRAFEAGREALLRLFARRTP